MNRRFRLNKAPSGPKLAEPTQKMMAMMLQLGADPLLIGVLLELAGYDRAWIRYLAGPVIIYQGPWAETLPRWVLPAIYQERLATIFTEHTAGQIGDLATPLEALAYLYPAAMQSPLPYEWQQVYLWCGQETLGKYDKLPPDTPFWTLLGSDRPLLLSDYERRYVLQPLQRQIRRKVIELAKSQGVGQPRRKTHTKPPPAPEDGGPSAPILPVSLFDLEANNVETNPH